MTNLQFENKMALKKIYNNLIEGKIYGQMYTHVRYPFFNVNIYITQDGNIGFSHYGSSAKEKTIESLEWILTIIFKCSPCEFIKNYECRNARYKYL